MKTMEQWKAVLRARLTEAMRAREREAVSVLREVLGALDDAEAADVKNAPPVEAGVIAGGVAGLGAGEVARRVVSPEQATTLVTEELRSRRAVAIEYRALGKVTEADALDRQAAVLEALLAG